MEFGLFDYSTEYTMPAAAWPSPQRSENSTISLFPSIAISRSAAALPGPAVKICPSTTGVCSTHSSR